MYLISKPIGFQEIIGYVVCYCIEEQLDMRKDMTYFGYSNCKLHLKQCLLSSPGTSSNDRLLLRWIEPALVFLGYGLIFGRVTNDFLNNYGKC